MAHFEKFFFVLGRIPCISVLELESVFSFQKEKTQITHTSPCILLASAVAPLPASLIARLGGTIKMGRCVAALNAAKAEIPILAQTLSSVINADLEGGAGRITIGASVYSLPWHIKNRTAWNRALALAIKKLLVEKGFSVRAVLPQKTSALTSVQVEKNGLVSKRGYEYVFMEENGCLVVGKTTAVQPFEEYSLRDWGRPAKAHQEGLLPPKIAQIMINLARVPIDKNTTILDPFCGSGTILQEALLMGYSTLQGSDLDPQAVTRTRKNLAWLSEKKRLSLRGARFVVQDATTLSSSIPHRSIDAIVSEPYLGPLFTRLPDEKKLQSVLRELSALYLSFFYEARLILKKNALCVIVVPVWLTKRRLFLPIYERILSLGFQNTTVPYSLKNFLGSPHMQSSISPRGGILFHRPGSVVGRELFVFRSA